MDYVLIEDPTTWTDAIEVGLMISTVVFLGMSIVFLHRDHRLLKLTAIIAMFAAVFALSFMEARREASIERSNSTTIEKAFDVSGLHQIGDDRPGGGVWLDPSAGKTIEIRAGWTDNESHTDKKGYVRIDATDKKRPKAVLMELK